MSVNLVLIDRVCYSELKKNAFFEEVCCHITQPLPMITRTILLPLVCLLIFHNAHAQELAAVGDQNPNAAKSLERYSRMKDSLLIHQGETVQSTYEAIQPWFDAWEERQQWKGDRREFRRQLRLERARRPVFQQFRQPRGMNPWVMPSASWNRFDNDWMWRYGLNFGMWPW